MRAPATIPHSSRYTSAFVLLPLFPAACAAPPGAAPHDAAPPDVPVYRCPRIDREIALTGKLDDPLWARAPVAPLVRADTGGAPGFATEARLLAGPAALYIGFRCVDDYVWGTKTRRDEAVYTEECVEVFISPAGTAHQYYEINVSPKNVVFDACVLNPRLEPGSRARYRGIPEFDLPGLRTSAHVEGEADRAGEATGWSVEYAIPYADLIGAPHAPPRPGDRWRLNLYRIDHPAGGKTEYSAWSPTTIIDFHLPCRFGVLEFE